MGSHMSNNPNVSLGIFTCFNTSKELSSFSCPSPVKEIMLIPIPVLFSILRQWLV